MKKLFYRFCVGASLTGGVCLAGYFICNLITRWDLATTAHNEFFEMITPLSIISGTLFVTCFTKKKEIESEDK